MDEKLDEASRRKLFATALLTDNFEPASALVRADIAARSDRGRILKDNDDHYLVVRLSRSEETIQTSLTRRDVPYRFDEYAYAAVVADGIGDEGAGAVAARLAVTTLAQFELRFGQWNMRIDPEVAADIMDRSRWFYDRAHEAVRRWQGAHQEVGPIAAAVTAIYSAGTDLFVVHVGHCRCYLFRGGMLTQLTRDQTLRAHLAATPQPTPVARALEDVEHILTSAIGAGGNGLRVIAEHFRLADDDILLLCTNGLTDMASDEHIADALASRRTPQEQCDLLVDAALANGVTDNVTVVLANYHIPHLRDDSK